MFNFNHLYYFHLVSSCGGISKAARILRITAPTLSFQIKALEQTLGFTLVKKIGHSLEITSDGKRVALYCERLFAPAKELADFVNSRSPGSIVTVKVGVSHGVERPFVAKLLSMALMQRGLEVELTSLVSGTHTQQIKNLSTHDIDVLISSEPVGHEGGHTLGEFSFPVLAICNQDYANLIEHQAKNSLELSLSHPSAKILVPYKSFRLGAETEIFLREKKLSTKIVFESDNLAALLTAASEGLGVALLPYPYIETKIKKGSLVVLSEQPAWQHNIYLSVQSSAPPHWISEALRQQLELLTGEHSKIHKEAK